MTDSMIVKDMSLNGIRTCLSTVVKDMSLKGITASTYPRKR